MSKVEKIFALLGLITALSQILIGAYVALYIADPGGFLVKVYPNTQIDCCLSNGSFVLQQTSGIDPSYSSSFNVWIIRTDKDIVELGEFIAVTNKESLFGFLSKPYNDEVILTAENKPPGIDVGFVNSSANSSFDVEFQDRSKIMGVPPFNSSIILKIAKKTLTYGPHYITIRGVGQDGRTESTCTSVLMVNKNCPGGGIRIG